MKKNVASQVIGAQLITAADGTAFTGSVTVAVTGDGGTQATGSVGAGACTHEGNGFHTYAPAQAETNYDHVAFTFTGTGAIPVTVQAYPTFPQTGDSYSRIGAPAGASVSADVAAVKAETATIVADTNELQGDWVDGGRLDLILDARASQTSVDTIDDLLDTEIAAIQTALTTIDTVVDSILVDTAEIGAAGAGLTALATQASVNTIDDFLDTEIAAIKAKTDNLPASPANEATLTTIAGYIDTEIGTLTTNLATVDTVVDAIKAKTDNLPAAPAATGDIPTAIQNADAVLNRGASNVEGTADRHSLGAMVMIGTNSSISGTTLTAKKPSDDTTFATYTLTAAAGADPIGGIA